MYISMGTFKSDIKNCKKKEGSRHRFRKYSVYLSDILDENLLGLLSCGVRHHKLISEITKHPHTNAKCITAEELSRTWGTKIVPTLTNAFDRC